MDSVELRQSNAGNAGSARVTESGRGTSLKAAVLFLVMTVIFYWKITLVHQYSLLLGFEGVNQAYAWFNFWVSTIRQGVWPLWDPFTFSGHAFAGEMQTGAFYPLYLIFLPIPFRDGLFSPQLYHVFFVLTHALCAWFVYLLAREFRLSVFAGLVAGVCFSLGGALARFSEWPDLLQSGIWLPLIVLLLVRALKAIRTESAVAWSAMSGLALAMAVLAGGLHVVIMDGIVIVSAAIFHAATTQPSRAVWTRTAIVVAVSCGFALAGGAVQLLPSAEYGRLALRWIGPTALPATQKIPYNYIGDALWPHGLLGLFLGSFAGASSGEYVDPYMGVLPVLLAIIGIWKSWACLWVRYLTGLAVAACLYSLGSFSLLHGFLYAVTPWLWAARESDRFMYLTGFSLAVLAGFGIDVLFRMDALFSNVPAFSWEPLSRVFKWVAVACVAALVYPFVLGGAGGGRSPLISLSFLFILLAYALYHYIIRGHYGRWARFLALALILFDLSAFDWSAINEITGGVNSRDKILETATHGREEMARLLSFRGAADFLRSRPGRFRVELAADRPPNVGDGFGIEETAGSGVTIQTDYNQLRTHPGLMNARYTVRPASATETGAVYQDSAWKVYENPSAFPRAWLVHATTVEPDPDKLLARLDTPGMDPHRIALLGTPLNSSLDAPADTGNEQADLRRSPQDRVEVDVHADGRALLVLSELFYPGWKATVNGQHAEIWKVDGGLRGIVVPNGDSRVSLHYVPASFFAGFALTSIAFVGGGILAFRLWRS
jgi:hypothetical protein